VPFRSLGWKSEDFSSCSFFLLESRPPLYFYLVRPLIILSLRCDEAISCFWDARNPSRSPYSNSLLFSNCSPGCCALLSTSPQVTSVHSIIDRLLWFGTPPPSRICPLSAHCFGALPSHCFFPSVRSIRYTLFPTTFHPG